jgi:hypothetical protein
MLFPGCIRLHLRITIPRLYRPGNNPLSHCPRRSTCAAHAIARVTRPLASASPQTTAHAYMRRFFLRRSIVEFDPRELLLAAVYLAAKVCSRTGGAAPGRRSDGASACGACGRARASRAKSHSLQL